MRSRRRILLEGAVLLCIAGPHAFGCATITRGTWDVTRNAGDLFARDTIRATCGGADACQALCEEMRSSTLDEPFRDVCAQTDHESYTIVGCEPRGRTLLITCEWEDDKKGCVPDS